MRGCSFQGVGGTLQGPGGSRGLRACLCHCRMLQTLKELEACSAEAKAKASAFQHLLFLVGIYLFKVWRPGGERAAFWGLCESRLALWALVGLQSKEEPLRPLSGPPSHAELPVRHFLSPQFCGRCRLICRVGWPELPAE